MNAVTRRGSVVLAGASLAWVFLATLAGCGGSSSETPFPLPPHRLNDPYRAPRVMESPPPPAEPVAVDEEEDDALTIGQGKGGSASTTWGGDAVAPLPEMAPR